MKKLLARLKSQHETRQTGSNAKIWRAATTFLLFTFTFLLISPRISFAQDCSVAGTVRDSSGSGTPGVIVTADEQRTGLNPSTTTDQNGYYRLLITCHNALYLTFRCPESLLGYSYFIDAWSSGEKIFDPPRSFDCAPPPTPTPPSPSPSPSPSPGPSPSPFPSPSPYPSPGPSPTPGPYPSLTCDLSKHGDRTSRPIPCDACNQTNLLTFSCAESFTVHDNVSFYWWEGAQCLAKPEEYWVETPWEGIVTVNPSETTIPFVGYKGEGKDKSDYEQKYLADYFEGTNEYYQNYGKYWLDWVNHAGVLRKLTPMEYQDKLKENMIENRIASPGAPQEGKVHDYELNYIGRLCWDTPFSIDALIAIAQALDVPVDKVAEFAHYCLFSDKEINPLDDAKIAFVHAALDTFNALPLPVKITHDTKSGTKHTLSELSGNFPPDPSEENYIEKWNQWKESEWGRLWEVVPMVSREDTPGYISPYLGYRPKDEPKNIPPQIEKVPHVARLYEASQEVQKIMTPLWQAGGTAQKETGTIIASAAESEENVLGEKTLLAQGPGVGYIPCGCKVLYPSPTCDCMKNIKPDGEPDCLGESRGNACDYHMWGGCICGYIDCDPSAPPNCQCAVSFCSGPPAPPPAPACGLAEPLPVYSCKKPAITDSNPNDDLCCDPIKINLTAVDSFINENYTPCGYGCDCCDPPEAEGCLIPCLCNKCMNITTEEVSRKFGINLSHPYLTEIWNQTGNADTAGIFNYFRPASVPKFSDIDAASEINYSYCSNQVLGICLPGGTGSVEPSTGKFYFPYLGGVQLAKQWLIQTLTPWK